MKWLHCRQRKDYLMSYCQSKNYYLKRSLWLGSLIDKKAIIYFELSYQVYCSLIYTVSLILLMYILCGCIQTICKGSIRLIDFNMEIILLFKLRWEKANKNSSMCNVWIYKTIQNLWDTAFWFTRAVYIKQISAELSQRYC